MTKNPRVALAAIASFVLASGSLLSAPTVAAQGSAALARLEQRLARRPDDPRLLCEVGWARFVADRGDAIQALERGIAGMGAPTEREAQRRLAACLESRGRVAERRGAWADAIASYERSLVLRPNEAIAARATSVREFVAAGWSRAAVHARRDAVAAPADVAATLGAGRAFLLGRWQSSGRDEAVLVAHEAGSVSRAVLLVRRAGSPWLRLDLDELHGAGDDEVLTLAAVPGEHGAEYEVLHTWEARVGDGEWESGAVRKVVAVDGTRLRVVRS